MLESKYDVSVFWTPLSGREWQVQVDNGVRNTESRILILIFLLKFSRKTSIFHIILKLTYIKKR